MSESVELLEALQKRRKITKIEKNNFVKFRRLLQSMLAQLKINDKIRKFRRI